MEITTKKSILKNVVNSENINSELSHSNHIEVHQMYIFY